MRIVAWDELAARGRVEVGLLDWSDGDPPTWAERLAALRSDLRYRTYRPLFAVDRGRVVGRVGALDLKFRSDDGDATVLGICDVVTAPTELGRGIAHRLLDEVHRRNHPRVRGYFLWTRRSWGAHRLYERMGYRDVYSPEVLVRRLPARRAPGRPAPLRLRAARRADHALLEQLLARSTLGRVGILPRPAGSFETRFRLGSRRPHDYQILERRGKPIGYLWARRDEHQVMCEEIVVADRSDQPRCLEELERWAAGRLLAVGTTSFVRDQADRFRARGYLRLPGSHRVLMFRGLRPDDPGELRRVRRIFRDPRLSAHEGDRF